MLWPIWMINWGQQNIHFLYGQLRRSELHNNQKEPSCTNCCLIVVGNIQLKGGFPVLFSMWHSISSVIHPSVSFLIVAAIKCISNTTKLTNQYPCLKKTANENRMIHDLTVNTVPVNLEISVSPRGRFYFRLVNENESRWWYFPL